MAASAAPAAAPKAFPLIPLTKEFMSMLGTKDEKAIYALKPVFATRCERISSTNKLLERAVLFSQDGTLRLIDTADGRITHTLELGDQRNMDWNITVVADREKDPKTHTHGVRIVIDKSNTRAAFESRDEKDSTEEIVLQFHCARAPVAVNFVAMLRHFVSIKGVKEKFTMHLQTDSVVNETASSRGSLDIISNKFAAARKSSFMNKSPERSQSFAEEARKQKKETERRGEAIEVLAPAVVPTVREQQKREKEEAARKKREKEEAEKRAADEAAAAAAAIVAAEEAEKQAARKREILAALAASSHAAQTAAAAATDATAPAVVTATQNEPSSPREDKPTLTAAPASAPGGYDSDEDNAIKPRNADAAVPTTSASSIVPVAVVADDAYGETTVIASQATPPSATDGSTLVTAPQAAASLVPQGNALSHPPAHSDATAAAPNNDQEHTVPTSTGLEGQNNGTSESENKSNMRSILERLRLSKEGGGIKEEEEEAERVDSDNNVDDDNGEEHPPMDEDSFIDSLSPKEAQQVVSGIMNSIEDLKDEQEQLMLEREALQKSLRELSSVTLGAEHALGLAGLIWSVCDLKLIRHFSR